MECPSLENLIAYAEAPTEASQPRAGDETGDAISSAVGTHLASGCGRCAADVDWFRRVMAVAASDDSVEPPPWVLKRALKLFETRVPETLSTPGQILERLTGVIASLIFDSAAGQAVANARAVEAADRQLLYCAGAYHIDLQIAAATGEGAVISGQILRDGEMAFESVAGLMLSLTRNGQAAGSTTTNRFGEFSLSPLERGQYDLQVEANEISITVVGLPIA